MQSKIPPKVTKKKPRQRRLSRRFNICLVDEMIKRVDEYAHTAHATLSEIIRQALRQLLWPAGPGTEAIDLDELYDLLRKRRAKAAYRLIRKDLDAEG